MITRNDLNSGKTSLSFIYIYIYIYIYIFEFQKIVQNFDKMLPERNFESQFETLNAL